MDNTLMHMCCAPCANQPIAQLREEGLSVTGFWFNPNIHPYTEYQARKRTLEDYAREIGMKMCIRDRSTTAWKMEAATSSFRPP